MALARLAHPNIEALPGDILIGKDGRVRVVDFGLARMHADDSVAEPGQSGDS